MSPGRCGALIGGVLAFVIGSLGAVTPALAGRTVITAAPTDALAPTAQRSYIALIVTPTPARSAPGGPVLRVLATQTPTDGGPEQLLVVGSRRTGASLWLQVLLPYRPNGSTAWVDANLVQLHASAWRVDISTEARRLELYRAGRVVLSIPTVVGKPSTPTPEGRFAIFQIVPQRPADGFVGPWELQLTALSTALRSFDGGPGRVAIHGRDGASLLDPLGTARSHGCVRIADAEVEYLAAHLEPGVPVTIS